MEILMDRLDLMTVIFFTVVFIGTPLAIGGAYLYQLISNLRKRKR